MAAEEDRISNMPEDIIHHILSFLDMKEALQTCTLSKKWKPVWKSMPYLNLNSDAFLTLHQFSEFVEHVLSHRNSASQVSAVKLTVTETDTQFDVKRVVDYAYSHNVSDLTIIWSSVKLSEFPEYLFGCQTLKHLTLASNHHHQYWYVPLVHWDFPALETLKLRNIVFGDVDHAAKRVDLFSKCVRLTELTLDNCSMFQLDTFNICGPKLIDLRITDPVAFPQVLNVVAPQLQNLTTPLSVIFMGCPYLNPLQLSTPGFDSLEKVNLSLRVNGNGKEKYAPVLLDLFQKIHTVKYLTLSVGIIQALSSGLDELSNEACPFDGLKYLEIDMASVKRKDECITTIPAHVGYYLLGNSPNAIFVMDLRKVALKKRSRLEIEIDPWEENVGSSARVGNQTTISFF